VSNWRLRLMLEPAPPSQRWASAVGIQGPVWPGRPARPANPSRRRRPTGG